MTIEELYLSGLSTRKISKQIHKSPATIYRYLFKLGIVRNKSESLQGEKHPFYKGGHIGKNGYKLIWVKGKLMGEHRYIMENHVGRQLERFEHVHHRDGNKLNNDISNLELTTIFEHQKYHSISSAPKICQICRKRFYRQPITSIRVWMKRKTCSNPCRYKLQSQFMIANNGLH